MQDSTYDVVVVGGGTTGLTAALAAARTGAKTALIEENGYLGGNATTQLPWMAFHDKDGRRVVGGIPFEIIERLRKRGAATKFYLDPIIQSTVGVNPHWLKILAAEMMQQDGVSVFLHTRLMGIDAVTHAGAEPSTIELSTPGGLVSIRSRYIIDATDTGDPLRMCGVPLVRGRREDGLVQVASWTFTLGGVNFPRLMGYFRENPTEIRPFPLSDPMKLVEHMERAEVFILGAFRKLIRQAREEGLDVPRSVMPGVGYPPLGEVMTVASRIENIRPNDPTELGRGAALGMQQCAVWVEFLNRYVPGFESARLALTPGRVGVRESVHMQNDFMLDAEHLLSGVLPEDTVSMGGYFLDIHAPNADGRNEPFVLPPAYGIPYRSLVAQDNETVLAAGRVIAATHEAMSSTRVIPISMGIGQAAGTAAALAAQRSCPAAEVPIADLQDQLRCDGVILDDADLTKDPTAIDSGVYVAVENAEALDV